MQETEQYFATSFSIVYRKFQKYITQEMEAHGIKASEFPFLATLLNAPSHTLMQDEMCRRTAINKAAASRALQALEEKNVVYRKQQESGYKANRVYLTEKGLLLLPVIEKVLNDWSAFLLTGYTDEEKIHLKKEVRAIALKLRDEE